MSSPHRPLGHLTWPEVGAATAERPPVLLVPLGSTEQHGPHLPLDTDTRIAEALARAAAATVSGVVVAPAVAYGSSGEHAGFPGTLSIGQEALEALVVELVRSADVFGGVVLVCGHAGNAEPVARAVRTLTGEGRAVRAWFPRVGDGDAHAGRTETSMLLHLDPSVVQIDRAEVGATAPVAELIDDLRHAGVKGVAPNGVLGDPSDASADEGRRLVAAMVDELTALLAELTQGWSRR
ncbi:mycofactocin biosynthesis peptidyl-dipeptidase MftE [Rhabdothermincola salaria]|uniref:mycofactocin biosynthesis peptidyl-dipeptidase MftE n=1 Tax=Rhabdothermincola salaria TaxID=2903142 RepID=UPI001E2F2161|nr:mycofactocin biosynthesis peptidyl-dipeptidase MftE [Rhabdothermincola salaria]